MPEPDCRLYIDESGNHSPCTNDGAGVGERYLGLCGVVMPRGTRYEAFCEKLDALKRECLPYDPDDVPILHRKEILNRSGAFSVLADDAKRGAFDTELLDLLRKAPLRVIAVAVDKCTHGRAKHRSITDPYHYALLAMLQRYCGWLQYAGRRGDLMAEARGGVEDKAFSAEYERLYRSGGPYLPRELVQGTLTSSKPKMKRKERNIAGLQVADALAHPLTRDVLVAYERLPNLGSTFADLVVSAVRQHYNRRMDTGRIRGYGQVFLG